jgi:hypothetical protein
MSALRFLILAVVIALGTVLVDWWIVPVVGLAYGLVSRRSKAPGTVAALAGAVAWGGYLAIIGFGGAPVGSFGGNLARSLELPAWLPHVATMVFPALLAGSAAYLGARVGMRPGTRPGVRPGTKRR